MERTERMMVRLTCGVHLNSRTATVGLVLNACGKTKQTAMVWSCGVKGLGFSKVSWLNGVITARQHRKVNLCQLRG